MNERRLNRVSGIVTDPGGVPLAEATLTVGDNPPQLLQHGHFDSTERGGYVYYTFSAPGYHPRRFEISDEGLHEMLPDQERGYGLFIVTPKVKPTRLQVVLEPIKHPTTLITSMASLELIGQPDGTCKTQYAVVDHPRVDDRTMTQAAVRTSYPENALYLAADFEPAKFGERSLRFPKRIGLRLNSSNGGILPVPFQNAQFTNGRPRTAPPSGYLPEITFPSPAANNSKPIYFPFYFKTDRLYGRGTIMSVSRGTTNVEGVEVPVIEVRVVIHLQPDGTRDVE
jgi:hypothetical protein